MTTHEDLRTSRGFAKTTFADQHGVECSLQKSSVATEDCIWLGCNDANPRVLIQGAGWVPWPMPKEYVADTRMHLTREQAAFLAERLQRFADTGEL